jgi:hypothetical protein
MGSDKYVYLPLSGDRAVSRHLDELAADAGASDLGAAEGLVTRLSVETGMTPDAQPAGRAARWAQHPGIAVARLISDRGLR